jgi:superfamily II DNA or RNA helicase
MGADALTDLTAAIAQGLGAATGSMRPAIERPTRGRRPPVYAASERREVTAQLASIPENEPRLVLATGRYIGEGFDDARLDTLFLTMPVSWKGTLVQYAGRLHRLHPGKAEVRIYDYVDLHVPLFQRMFEKRLRGYRAIGYARDDGPPHDDAGTDDATGDAGATETPATPISRKTRRPRGDRRVRKPSRAPW